MILGIYGAGGNGLEVRDLARRVNDKKHQFDEIVFIDDVIEAEFYYQTKVFTFDEALNNFKPDEIVFVTSVGEPKDREMIYSRVKSLGYKFATIIDPNAQVSPSANIGEGAVIALIHLGPETVIGENTLISEWAVIGHNTHIGKHCNVSPGAFIAGHCRVGDAVYVGPQSAIRDRINVGSNTVIAMSAAVYKDVPKFSTAIGNPAKNLANDGSKGLF